MAGTGERETGRDGDRSTEAERGEWWATAPAFLACQRLRKNPPLLQNPHTQAEFFFIFLIFMNLEFPILKLAAHFEMLLRSLHSRPPD